jgi:predicted phosphoribosyltransferase
MFASRLDAARKLAEALRHHRGSNPLVLAIPRGAVEMGLELATQLQGELDVVLVRKLRAPGNPELAVGAMSGAGAQYLEDEKRRQMELLRERRARYTPARPPIDAKDRTVIVVDDGLATGATMIAALHAARAKQPARLVCAVPVAAPSSLAQVRPYADEVVCLETPGFFYAVSQFYAEFSQVEDDEVTALLARAASPTAAGGH